MDTNNESAIKTGGVGRGVSHAGGDRKASFGEKEVGYFNSGYEDLDATRKTFAAALDSVDLLRSKAEEEGNVDKIANYDQAIELIIKANFVVSNAIINNFQ